MKLTKVTPVHDRITIRKIEESEVTEGGLYKPEKAIQASQLGVVVAVGDGRNYDGPAEIDEIEWQGESQFRVVKKLRHHKRPCIVKPGDKVLYGKYSGAEVEVGDDKVFVLREDEILAIVETDEEPN